MSSEKEKRLSYLVGLSLMGTVAFTGLTAINSSLGATAYASSADSLALAADGSGAMKGQKTAKEAYDDVVKANQAVVKASVAAGVADAKLATAKKRQALAEDSVAQAKVAVQRAQEMVDKSLGELNDLTIKAKKATIASRTADSALKGAQENEHSAAAAAIKAQAAANLANAARQKAQDAFHSAQSKASAAQKESERAKASGKVLDGVYQAAKQKAKAASDALLSAHDRAMQAQTALNAAQKAQQKAQTAAAQAKVMANKAEDAHQAAQGVLDKAVKVEDMAREKCAQAQKNVQALQDEYQAARADVTRAFNGLLAANGKNGKAQKALSEAQKAQEKAQAAVSKAQDEAQAAKARHQKAEAAFNKAIIAADAAREKSDKNKGNKALEKAYQAAMDKVSKASDDMFDASEREAEAKYELHHQQALQKAAQDAVTKARATADATNIARQKAQDAFHNAQAAANAVQGQSERAQEVSKALDGAYKAAQAKVEKASGDLVAANDKAVQAGKAFKEAQERQKAAEGVTAKAQIAANAANAEHQKAVGSLNEAVSAEDAAREKCAQSQKDVKALEDKYQAARKDVIKEFDGLKRADADDVAAQKALADAQVHKKAAQAAVNRASAAAVSADADLKNIGAAYAKAAKQGARAKQAMIYAHDVMRYTNIKSHLAGDKVKKAQAAAKVADDALAAAKAVAAKAKADEKNAKPATPDDFTEATNITVSKADAKGNVTIKYGDITMQVPADQVYSAVTKINKGAKKLTAITAPSGQEVPLGNNSVKLTSTDGSSVPVKLLSDGSIGVTGKIGQVAMTQGKATIGAQVDGEKGASGFAGHQVPATTLGGELENGETKMPGIMPGNSSAHPGSAIKVTYVVNAKADSDTTINGATIYGDAALDIAPDAENKAYKNAVKFDGTIYNDGAINVVNDAAGHALVSAGTITNRGNMTLDNSASAKGKAWQVKALNQMGGKVVIEAGKAPGKVAIHDIRQAGGTLNLNDDKASGGQAAVRVDNLKVAGGVANINSGSAVLNLCTGDLKGDGYAAQASPDNTLINVKGQVENVEMHGGTLNLESGSLLGEKAAVASDALNLGGTTALLNLFSQYQAPKRAASFSDGAHLNVAPGSTINVDVEVGSTSGNDMSSASIAGGTLNGNYIQKSGTLRLGTAAVTGSAAQPAVLLAGVKGAALGDGAPVFNGNVALFDTNADLGNAKFSRDVYIGDGLAAAAVSKTRFGTSEVEGTTNISFGAKGSKADLDHAVFKGLVKADGGQGRVDLGFASLEKGLSVNGSNVYADDSSIKGGITLNDGIFRTGTGTIEGGLTVNGTGTVITKPGQGAIDRIDYKAGKVGDLYVTGNTNLVLHKSIAASDIDSLHYDSAGSIVKAGDKTISAGNIFLGKNVTQEKQLGEKVLSFAKDANGNKSITVENNSSLDFKAIEDAVADTDKGQLVIIDSKDGSIYSTQYDAKSNKWQKIGFGSLYNALPVINGYNAMYESGFSNPFQAIIPGKTVFDNAEAILANKNTLPEGKAAAGKFITQTMHAAKALSTPVLAAMQSVNVINDITLGNVASRTAILRAQAAENGNVQGADDNGKDNIWIAIKHNKVTVDNSSGYADSDVKVNSYTLGYDAKSSEHSYFGGYISQTSGDVETAGYDADIRNSTGFGLYSTTLLGKGKYVNCVGHVGEVKTSLYGQDWKTKDYGLSVEYGRKAAHKDGLFITPYVRMSYDHLDSDTARWGGNTVEGDASNNFGLKLGLDLMKNDSKGNSYYGGVAFGKGFSGSYKLTVNGIALPDVDNNGSTVYLNLGTRQKISGSGSSA